MVEEKLHGKYYQNYLTWSDQTMMILVFNGNEFLNNPSVLWFWNDKKKIKRTGQNWPDTHWADFLIEINSFNVLVLHNMYVCMYVFKKFKEWRPNHT